jgi:hypothetical protein
MSRTVAEQVIERLLAASGALNDAVRLMQADAPDALFQEYRKHTADVMAAIHLDLLKPIVKDYPDLDPGREDAREQ